MAGSKPDPTTNMRRIEFRLSEEEIRKADEIAYELSEPGPAGSVSRADVLREACVRFNESFNAETDTLESGRLAGEGAQT